MSYNFHVPGTPLPTPRPRATSIGNKARIYIPDRVGGGSMKAWRASIVELATAACQTPLDGPVSAVLSFTLKRPKSHLTSKGVLRKGFPVDPIGPRQDIDNLSKAVLDSLNGVAFHDDGQVVRLDARKSYGRSPGVYVSIASCGVSE